MFDSKIIRLSLKKWIFLSIISVTNFFVEIATSVNFGGFDGEGEKLHFSQKFLSLDNCKLHSGQ